MNGKGARPKDDGEKVPGWIISFTDMITLLLAFFVLLQAFARVRDPKLFYLGQGSFQRAIAGLGVPDLLFGKRARPEYEYKKKKNPTEADKDKSNKNRVLDAEDEKIRKLFADLKKTVETKTSDLTNRVVDVMPTPIRFRTGAAELDAAGREFLKTMAVNLAQSLQAKDVRIHVVGLGADATYGRQQWILSARRAEAAEQFLRQALSDQIHRAGWRIDSWGAGSGDRWCSRFGVQGKQSFIVVGVVKTVQVAGR